MFLLRRPRVLRRRAAKLKSVMGSKESVVESAIRSAMSGRRACGKTERVSGITGSA